MKIDVDGKAGFCFGVVEAIKKAEEYLENNDTLYCLGQIVHNEAEANRLKEKGLISLNYEQFQDLKDAIVLIRAHGEPPSTYETAQKNNLTLIDATCPLVTRLQKKIKKTGEHMGEQDKIVIYGNPTHPEVIGLAGQEPERTIIIQDEKEISDLDLTGNIHLYSQTTKDKTKYEQIRSAIGKKQNTDIAFNDSICRQVYNRKDELGKFAAQHDVMIFVGGTKSSNARVLYNVCKEANKDSYFISDKNQLNEKWFEGSGSIGISGATSTPQWQMEEVAEVIKSITR